MRLRVLLPVMVLAGTVLLASPLELAGHGSAAPALSSASPSSPASLPEVPRTPAAAGGIRTIITNYTATQVISDPLNRTVDLVIVPSVGSTFMNVSVRSISFATYRDVANYTIPGRFELTAALDSGNGTLYLVNTTGTLTALAGDTLRALGSQQVRAGVSAMLYNPVDRDLFLAGRCAAALGAPNATITVLNATTGAQVAAIPMACDPNGMAFDSANGNVFVLDGSGGNLSVISPTTLTVIATVPNVSPSPVLGLRPPAALTFDRRDGNMYVRCVTPGSPGCFEVFNGSGGPKFLRHFGLFLQGGFAVDGLGNLDFLAWNNSSVARTEYLMSLSPPNGTITTVTSLACTEDNLAFNPVNQELFASAHCGPQDHGGSIALFSIRPYASVTTFALTNSSYLLYPSSGDFSALDPQTGAMVVAFPDFGGGSGVGIVGPFPITFSISVYAPRVEWTVGITFASGYNESFTTFDLSTTVYLVNGSYNFSYSTPPGFFVTPTGGSFTMAGQPLTERTTCSWQWWVWATVVAGLVVVGVGVRHARRLRKEFFKRRAPAAAKLRYDLQHPLVYDDADEPAGKPPP